MTIVSIVNMTWAVLCAMILGMARYTLDRINEKIELWEAADDAISLGQDYQIDGFRLTRADAGFIEKKLDRLYAERNRIERGVSGKAVVRRGRVAR